MFNLFKSNRQQHHRPASQDVNADNNKFRQEQSQAVNINQVDKYKSRDTVQSNPSHHTRGQAHSMTRDLAAMGLMTQVKRGDDARLKKTQAIPQRPIGQQLVAPQSQHQWLLRPQTEAMKGRKTLLLDVDETLVHSSFTPSDIADIVLPIDIEGRTTNIFVNVRPNCCEFIKEVGKYFEVVIFTASLSKYAIPLMDILDPERVAPQRLFREHCTYFNGQFVKDMQRVGRRMEDTIIIDNSPNSYQFQPENGIPCVSWYDDPNDDELFSLIPALKLLSQVEDVRPVLLQATTDNVFCVETAIKICNSLLYLEEQREKEEIMQQNAIQRQAKAEQEQVQAKERQFKERQQKLEQILLQQNENKRYQSNDFQESEEFENKPEQTKQHDQNEESSKRQDQLSSKEEKDQSRQEESSTKYKRISFHDQDDESSEQEAWTESKNKDNQSLVQDSSPKSNTKDPKTTSQAQMSDKSIKNQQVYPTSEKSSNQRISREVIQTLSDQSSAINISFNRNKVDHTDPDRHQSYQGDQLQPQKKPINNWVPQSSSLESDNIMQQKKPRSSSNSKKLSSQRIQDQNSGFANKIKLSSGQTQSSRIKTQDRFSTEDDASNKYFDQYQVMHAKRKQVLQHDIARKQNSEQQKRKLANSLNPDKLKQYLLSTQLTQQNVEQPVPRKSVNSEQKEITKTKIKKCNNSLNSSQKQLHGLNQPVRRATAEIETKHQITSAPFKHGRSSAQAVQIRSSSQKPGETESYKLGKRRANSNHVDKKVILDKFLSVVQQRANYTPSSQLSGAQKIPGVGNIVSATAATSPKDERRYQSTSLNFAGQKKGSKAKGAIVVSNRSNSGADKFISKKKLSVNHHDREVGNKSGGPRGMQLTPNEIVFSKTMNLSNFLSAQQKVAAGNSSKPSNMSPTAKMQINHQKSRARDDIARTAEHKRQKSNTQVRNSGASNLNASGQPPNQFNSQQNQIQHFHQKSGNAAGKPLETPKNQAVNSAGDSVSRLRTSGSSVQNKRQSVSKGGSSRVVSSSGKIKTSKKQHRESSAQPLSTVKGTAARNSHRIQAALDDQAYQFAGFTSGGHTGGTAAHSLTRSNRDYQRSPGKIFHGPNGSNTMFINGQGSAKNAVQGSQFKQVGALMGTAQPISGKRQSNKPTLMSELTLSLKNKKSSTSSQGAGKGAPSAGYSSLIKPEVKAGRAPNSTKASSVNQIPAQFDQQNSAQMPKPLNANNFSSAYTARIGGVNTHVQLQAPNGNTILKKQQVKQSHGLKHHANYSLALQQQQIAQSQQKPQKNTPKKKKMKLVNNSRDSRNHSSSLNQEQNNSNILLNQYYQSMQRQKDQGISQPGSLSNSNTKSFNSSAANNVVVPVSVSGREFKQTQQIQGLLSDFESTSRFTKQQLKNFGSPKGTVMTQPQSTTNANSQGLNLNTGSGTKSGRTKKR